MWRQLQPAAAPGSAPGGDRASIHPKSSFAPLSGLIIIRNGAVKIVSRVTNANGVPSRNAGRIDTPPTAGADWEYPASESGSRQHPDRGLIAVRLAFNCRVPFHLVVYGIGRRIR